MNVYGLTDKGLIREVNEDCIGISTLSNGITICVVCDGMGGVAGGKIASAIGEHRLPHLPNLSCSPYHG